MKQLVILSGKGGTGKTTVAAALAHLASQEATVVLADADVDAANLELVLAPEVRETHVFTGGKLAVIDAERCQGCGLCETVCRFGAIGVDRELANGREHFRVDPVACEGCGACIHVCPEHAIKMSEQPAGRWYLSETRLGPLVHARLFAGQENSGKLVTRVALRARDVCLSQSRDYVIVDGPPGIGCPVMAAASRSDVALVVAEPTVAGAHDLERILGLLGHFGMPALVCINKWDVNPARADEIDRECAGRGLRVVGRIPFDTVVTEAMVRGQVVTEAPDNPVARALRLIWAGVKAALG